MNRQYFSDKQAKSGELDAFLASLRSLDYGKGDYYNDVHVMPEDLGAYIVEWEQMRWDGDENCGFKFVDSEHAVMLERAYPDGSFGYFFDEEDYENVLADWLEAEKKAGRVWKKSQFGRWYEESLAENSEKV